MDDDEQWGFQSDAKQSVIVISVLQAAFPADKILKTANVLADQRLNAETKLRAHRNVQFGDKFVELKDDGALGYVAYAGYDDYTIFRFAGWVTGRKVLSLFVETRTRDNALSKAVFKEVLDGFGFYRP